MNLFKIQYFYTYIGILLLKIYHFSPILYEIEDSLPLLYEEYVQMSISFSAIWARSVNLSMNHIEVLF